MLCQARRENSRLSPQKLCPHGGGREEFTVSKEQGVTSSGTIFRLVDIRVKFQASSTFWFQPV